MTKTLTAIISLLLLSSCISYGNIDVISRYNQARSSFSYAETGNSFIVKGLYSSGEYFEGLVKTTKQTRKEQSRSIPNYYQSYLKPSPQASINLSGSQGHTMVCSVRQLSESDFAKGGVGTCYISDGEIADIVVYDASPPWFFQRTTIGPKGR
jgi:hypothetical protein